MCKNQAGTNLTTPSQKCHVVRRHCTAESKRRVAEIIIITPECGEYGVEDGARVVEEILHLGVHAGVGQVPVGADLTLRTHRELIA